MFITLHQDVQIQQFHQILDTSSARSRNTRQLGSPVSFMSVLQLPRLRLAALSQPDLTACSFLQLSWTSTLRQEHYTFQKAKTMLEDIHSLASRDRTTFLLTASF